jgi:outer membrane receptor protein involved in Fe transport
LIERWFASGTFSNSYIQCSTNCPPPTVANPTINYNHMPGAFYLDIGATYSLFDNGVLYAKINNVANVAPPPAPGAAGPSNGVNNTIYDVIGRMFYVGVRFRTP